MRRLGSAALFLVVAACAPPPGGGNTGGGSGTGGGSSSGAGGGSSSGTGGGTSSGTGGGSATASQLPCDVESILKTSCAECHANPPLFGAPMPLVTWADTQADSAAFPGQKIHQRMAARVGATVKPMPQPPRMLTAQQISTIQAWSMAGAPQGSGSCGGTGGGSGGSGGSAGGGSEPPGCPQGSTKIDIVAPAFTIPQTSDFYQCFSQTVSLPAKRHAIKIDKVIDDARVLHHVVLFRDIGKNAKPMEADCGVEADWQALYAWGPGAGPMIPPPDVGIPLNNGDQLVIQIHYNNAASVQGKDSSGAYICVTDQLKTNEAGVLAIGPTSFDLPPNCPATSVQGDCNNPPLLNTTFNVFTVWPHMHVRGRAMTTTLKRSGQADQLVTNRPVYDFGSQYLEAANFQFRPGDTLVNRCTWDTMGAPGVITWGEETSREMCFNFLYMYPAPPVPFCPATNTTQASCP